MRNWKSLSPKILAMTALCGLMTMSAGCQTTEKRLETAAATKGKVSAGVPLAPLPDDRRKHMGPVVPKVGEKVKVDAEALGIQRRCS